MESPTDAELVGAVLGGDADAFRRLVERHAPRYARYTRRMLGNREDAEEVLQNAFLRAYRALASCQDRERFGAWLHRIVVNQCRTAAVRRSRQEKWRVHGEQNDLVLNSVAEPAAGEDSSLAEEVAWAVEQLDPLQREAFLLKHVEELSYEEMVAITGAGESALKMRVKRACERLRKLLEGVHHG